MITWALLAAPLAAAPATSPPGWPARAETGFLLRWDCRTGIQSDTLRPGPSPAGENQIWRNGSRLLAGRDYLREGDTAVLLASPPGDGDTLCFVYPESPALPQPHMRLYDTAEIPVWRDSAPPPSALRTQGAAEADTGTHRLALSGSKSLAVSVGGGGVGLDAALFVNLSGQLADNVQLEGSLSDQNVPVQPEGNTATLREVDNKYLRVYGRQYEYLLGDYLLGYGREGEDGFFGKAEGARLRAGAAGMAASLQYARSKGIFHSDTLRGVEGKQRGYYLRGRDGRTFITVLAGTERIWRNGTLLRRGADYTIDYAEGRVDFLREIRISGENLFTAEFQYAEDSFPRSLAALEAADTAGSFRYGFRGVQEWEDADHPAAGRPDDSLLRRYRNAGDSVLRDSAGRVLPMPERLGGGALFAEWEGGERGRARFTVLGSQQDRNLYSSRDDGDNLGFSTRFSGRRDFGAPLNRGGWTRLSLEPWHEHRSRDFASFHQPVEARAFRDAWNLDAVVGERDFDANRLRASVEPYAGLRLGGEAGLASGRVSDSADARSLRTAAFSQADWKGLQFELAAEAKRARDPLRRDNFRQRASAQSAVLGWTPRAAVVHDEWLASHPGAFAWSHLWSPEAGLESPALWNRWVSGTGVQTLIGRSNYLGRESEPRDSLFDVSVSQKLRLLSWGPVSGEVFGSRQFHRVYRPQPDGSRPTQPEEAVYDLAEAELSALGFPRGYGLQSQYRLSRTAEIPLVENYVKVEPGRGEYRFDSLLNVFHRVESGGDYALVGLRRDTLVGEKPYQDLQWSLRLDLVPGRWSRGPGGVLADLEFGLDLEGGHQDTTPEPSPLPLFTDDQIESARSGRMRYEPTLRWRSLAGNRSANARWRREYAKGAGLYAFRERISETTAEYRWEWSEDWELVLGGGFDSRRRQGLGSTGGAGFTEGQNVRAALHRHLPLAFTLIPACEYRRVRGEEAGQDLDLQGVLPRARVEKGDFFGGRASLEYAAPYFFGQGQGSYFATGGFTRGLTHRLEALAQAELRTYLHLNLSYLARLEPEGDSWDQKLSAEMRAVF